MALETDDLKKMTDLVPSLKNFMGFLAVQEVDRIVEVLSSALTTADVDSQSGSESFEAWLPMAKIKVVKELASAQNLFGFRDMDVRFPVDDFLSAYYNALIESK
jgi:hypothetical protein